MTISNNKIAAIYNDINASAKYWSQNNGSDSLRLTAHAIYGEEATGPKDNNLLGQLWQEYNESGKIESVGFDFKGNLLSKKQKVISNAELKSALDNYQTYFVDWTGLPNILGTQVFETSNEFDALNRPTKITLPEDVNTIRKEIIPTYNRAGALEKVEYDSTEYVKNIVYNAKGQRLLIAFGNDVMTRYVYSNSTFRLLRYRSEKYTYSQVNDTHTYTKQAGTNRQDDGFNFDLVGNIMKILNRVTDCGISGTTLGSDALDREFEYDPLYRVVSANGRESDTQDQNDYLYSDAPIPGSPNADNVRAYERQYSYDKLGNIQQLKQLGTNGFTRDFSYFSGKNTLEKIENATPSVIESFTYDNSGNQITAGTTRNYVWNAANQLITYFNQAGSNDPSIFAQYDYNSGGNRVSKLVRTGTAGSPVYERTIYIDGVFEYHILENGTTYEKNYVHVMDDKSRIAMVRIGDQFPDDISDSVTYNLEDQIGSSSMRLNTSGGVVDKEEYYPFGDSSLRTFSKKRYRYVGKEKDLESGLYYYGARYYAAWTCRFISVDPLAADYVHLTPYNNAGNKVVNSVDIDGMQEEGAETAPTNTIEIDISKDKREFASDYLPKTAADGQRIDLVNPESPFKNTRTINIFDAEKEQWKTTFTYEYDDEIQSSSGKYQEGTAEELVEELSENNAKNQNNKEDNNINTPKQVNNSTSNKGNDKSTNEKVGDAVGTTTTVGGNTAKVVESSAKDISEKKPKYKSKDIPTTKAWKEKISKPFKKIASVADKLGKALGVVSAVKNGVDAVKNFMNGNIKEGLKSVAKAAIDIGLMFLKANPVGMVISIGVSIFTSWW